MAGSGEERLQALASTCSDGIAVCRDGRITWANERLARWLGQPHAQLVGSAPEVLLEACEAQDVADGSFTASLRQPGGELRPVRIERLCDGPDTLWIFRDERRLRELEAEVNQATRALRAANHEIERLRERARGESSERDEILTVVSHELRTPVTVVTGYARLLLSERVGPMNDQQRQFLEESLKACKRMNHFIANLLENSRGAAGDAPLQVHEAPLRSTIEAVVQAYKLLLDEQRLDLQVAVAREADLARFDPLRIEQVLSNLVENAIKYARPGGRIRISTATATRGGRRFVEVCVADDGPGVAPADRERIFERYVRAGEGRKAGGLGLGLAICRQAVVAHGGVIGVTDSPWGGARFCFTLPVPSDVDPKEPR